MKSHRLLWLAAAAALFGAMPNAHAQATKAGTRITNSASVSYTINGVGQTDPADGVTSFTVDRKVAIKVEDLNGAIAVTPGQQAAASFRVTNSTNDHVDIQLSASDTSGVAYLGRTDSADATAFTYYLDDGDTPGVLDNDGVGNDDTLLVADADFAPSGIFLDSMAPDETRDVLVVITVPLTATDGSAAVIELQGIAHSAYTDQTDPVLTGLDDDGDPATGDLLVLDGGNLGAILADNTLDSDIADKIDNVFAEAADADTGNIEFNGESSAYGVFAVSAAQIAVAKTSVVVWSPVLEFDAPKAIPGAVVLYCVSVTNSATSTEAEGVTITDDIPANTTFVDADATLAVTSANSLRFRRDTTCTYDGWVNGSIVEDSDNSDAATAGLVPDGRSGFYDSANDRISTTWSKLDADDGGADAQTNVTTTMFMVKIAE